MAKQTNILILVLVLQVALAIGLIFTGTDSGAFVAKEKLLALTLNNIEKITIEQKGSPALVMKKSGDGWLLPDYFDFPVASDKLDGVTDKLFDASVSWPVATTPAAAKRFKVADDEFEKKLVVTTKGGTSNTLYMGTSPGFKKIHARLDDNDNIYAIKFSVYELADKASDWADQSYLHVDRDDISKIELPGLELNRESDVFAVKGLAENEQSNASQVQMLVTKLGNLSFQDVLGKTDKPEYKQAEPELVYSLRLKSGDQLSYTFSKWADKEDYVLKPSSKAYYFKVAKTTVDSLKEFSREKLVELKPDVQKGVGADDVPVSSQEPAVTVKP